MKRIILSVLLVAACMTQASAQGYIDYVTIDGMEYEVYHSGATLVNVQDRERTEAVIADSIRIDNKLYPVTKINSQVFYCFYQLTSVKIPKTVKYIGAEAFCGCERLKEIELPDSLQEIRAKAFSECTSLKKLVLPKKVAVVHSDIVYRCSSLESIDILSEVMMTLSENAFRTDPNKLLTSTYHSELQSINVLSENPSICSVEGVLYSKDLKTLIRCPEHKKGELIVPNGVERIEPWAFSNCFYLNSIQLPETLLEFGNRPIPLYTTNTGDYVMLNCLSLEELMIPNRVRWISDAALMGCTNLKKVVLPDSLTLIGCEAFRNDSCLIEMTLPENVDSIGRSAFWNCYKWTPSLPKYLRCLGDMAFASCLTPDSMIIGERLKSIGYQSLDVNNNNREKLKKVYVCQEEPLALGDNYDVYKIFGTEYVKQGRKTIERFPEVYADNCTLYVPTGSREKYQASAVWGNFRHIEEFDYQSSGEEEPVDTVKTENRFTALTAEGIEVFFTILSEEEKTCKVSDYAAVSEQTEGFVTIPSKANGYTVTEIGMSAFNSCQKVTGISIPETVTTIRAGAFGMCLGLIEIVIPQSVTTIETSMFWDCANLTSLILPESMTEIPDALCYDCRSLKSITIPEGVTHIGQNAFSNCQSLESIELPTGLESIGNVAFSSCTGLKNLFIPANVKEIGTWAFENCSGLTSITVETDNKFYDSREDCNALIESATNTLLLGSRHTVIPEGITSIGNKAFYNIKEIKTIVVPENVTSIGEYAFAGCSSLTALVIPENVSSIGRAAFSDAHSLASVNIPKQITTIKTETFANCKSLRTIEIPKGVTSIGGYAFSGCESMEYVVSQIEEPFQIGSTVFTVYDSEAGKVRLIEKLYVPNGTKGKYEATDGWTVFNEIIEGTPDAIQSPHTKGCLTEDIYDLQGIHITQPQRGRLYIINGKKFFHK